MQKKLIVFNGSPRRNGFTPQLLAEVVRGAESKGAKVKEYDLNREGIRGCQGCYYCRANEGCSVKDDVLAPMYADIKEADAILFGSPIYFYEITGQAKIWLDRMFPMIAGADFTPRYPGRKVATVFVQGDADVTRNEKVVDTFNLYMKTFGWELVDSIICGDTSNPDFALPEDMKARASAAGKALMA